MIYLTIYLVILVILYILPFVSERVHDATYDSYGINWRFQVARLFWPITSIIAVPYLLTVSIEELAAKRWRNK